MSLHRLDGKMYLTMNELVEIGKRLKEDQLRSMNLFDKVRETEKEIYWRYKAASEILSCIEDNVTEEINLKASNAEEQFLNPKRGLSRIRGNSPRGDDRLLLPPGTLLVKEHRFNLIHASNKTFRFLVIKEYGSLILLGEENGPIYDNPSSAARAATKNKSENGWRFFGVSE